MMLVAGVVLMQDESSYTTAAEEMVIATQDWFPCLPVTDTGNGISTIEYYILEQR